MAVRKKLEKIAHPVSLLPDEPKPSTQSRVGKTTTMQDTPTGRPNKYFHKKGNNSATTKQRKDCLKETNNADPSSTSEQSPSHVKTISETLTNLSSVSLHIPESNRTKERTVMAPDSDGTSSISSAIFSQSSPEKSHKPIPLSTANVEMLKLNTRNVNMRRGAEIHHPQLPSFGDNNSSPVDRNPSTKSNSHVEPTEMVDMLNTFNQSLSHAIAINQQLHNALLNAPGETSSRHSGDSRRRRHRRNISSAAEDDDYSSKFESATTSNTNRESLIENESSVHASSLASESRHESVSDRSHNNQQTISAETSAGNKSSTKSEVNTIANSNFNRPSVIVRNRSSSSTISSDINNAVSISNSGQSSHSVRIKTPTTSSKSSSIVLTQRSSSSSIPTEFSDKVTRAGADDHQSHQAAHSVRSVSSIYSDSISNRSTTTHPNSYSSIQTEGQQPITHHETNKENVSSSLNTSTAKPSTESPLNKHSSSSSIVSNIIQDSTIECKAPHENAVTGINTTVNDDLNQSIGSDIFAAFSSQTDQIELSAVSEANMSYATLGMVNISTCNLNYHNYPICNFIYFFNSSINC